MAVGIFLILMGYGKAPFSLGTYVRPLKWWFNGAGAVVVLIAFVMLISLAVFYRD